MEYPISLTNNDSTGACIFEEQGNHNQIVVHEKHPACDVFPRTLLHFHVDAR
jgi:hypothetical protein